MSDKPQRTTLRVTSCAVAYAGRQGNDQHFTIYEIEAEKEDGTPISHNLRSFEELPEGEVIEVTVKPYDHPDFGRTYTLSRIGGSGRDKRIKALEDRVKGLEESVQRLLEVSASDPGQHATD